MSAAAPDITAATEAALEFAKRWSRGQPDNIPTAYELIAYLGLLFSADESEQLTVLRAVALGDAAAVSMLSVVAASYRYSHVERLVRQAMDDEGAPL